METREILKNRQRDYGNFKELSEISQGLKKMSSPYIVKMNDDFKKEAISMILHKISRLLNGNHNKIDTWQDISGYAELVVNELKKTKVENERSKRNN